MEQPPAQHELGEVIFSSLRPGARVTIAGGANRPTFEIVDAALRASCKLGGQHVRCVDVLPGVVMRVSVDVATTSLMLQQEDVSAAIWQHLRPGLIDWLTDKSPSAGIRLTVGQGVNFEFGWSERFRLLDARVFLTVRHDAQFSSQYRKRRRRFPLVEPDGESQTGFRGKELLLDALKKGIQTNDVKYARLPAPVRYRVTGALAAWRAFRKGTDLHSSESVLALFQSEPIANLVKIFGKLGQSTFHEGAAGYSRNALALQASHSAVWQAFEVREGVFYEPSAALHRLLDDSYIADDVGIGHVQLPAQALCIIPEPSRWHRPGGCESIVLFKSASYINCVTWSHRDDPERSVVMDVIELSLANPERTIRELLDGAFKSQFDGMEGIRQHWRNSLDYAIKMLLYLSVRNAHVTRDRAYSEAPRSFPGLGRRKREERLAEIESLYDRHIVGPALLDEQPERAEPREPGTREVSSHWRRPHFRMQAHGAGATQRKLVFIGPTIVRADRLTG